MEIKTWHVELFVYEDEEGTTARAVLHSPAPQHVNGHGRTVKAPADAQVPEIGDEVAVARALHDLADNLLTIAADDIAAIEHHPVRLDLAGPSRVVTHGR
jgi:hypothetical protein